jgi:hypothetical protein
LKSKRGIFKGSFTLKFEDDYTEKCLVESPYRKGKTGFFIQIVKRLQEIVTLSKVPRIIAYEGDFRDEVCQKYAESFIKRLSGVLEEFREEVTEKEIIS